MVVGQNRGFGEDTVRCEEAGEEGGRLEKRRGEDRETENRG